MTGTRVKIHSDKEETIVLELLTKLGYKWFDGSQPKAWAPSRDSGSFVCFPYNLIIYEDKDITWED